MILFLKNVFKNCTWKFNPTSSTAHCSQLKRAEQCGSESTDDVITAMIRGHVTGRICIKWKKQRNT